MIIDFHTHIFPEKIASRTIGALSGRSGNIPSTDGTANGLIDSMKRGGVDISVALPVITAPRQFDSVNAYAESINATDFSGKRIISFGGISPDNDDIYGKMKDLKRRGFLGVKIHPDYQGVFIDDPRYIDIITIAKELDLIVVTHAGFDSGFPEVVHCPPEKARKVIEKTGHKKLVLAHYGGYRRWEEVYDFIAGAEVYIDTAFTLHEIEQGVFEKILNKHGADKVLFATDCPWNDQLYAVNKLKAYNLPQEILDKILYKNATELLKLNEL